jgi:predicted DNA-binding transcriptional regulator AlpA
MREREFATGTELEKAGIAKRQTLAKWRIYGRGPKYYKIHGAVRYRWSDVEEWLSRCATKPGSKMGLRVGAAQ